MALLAGPARRVTAKAPSSQPSTFASAKVAPAPVVGLGASPAGDCIGWEDWV